MGTVQSTTLNTDTDAKRTSSVYGDAGDGVSRWFQWRRSADGGDATQGALADAAVTDPTASGSVVALLKGILTATRISAAGLLKAEDAAAASGDSGVMALAIRRDTAVSDVGAAGDYHPLHVDALGRLRVTPPRPTKASTTALAASLIAKASGGTLYRAVITNTGAAQYVQVHNTTTVPADTAVPAMVVYVPASSTFVLDVGAAGLAFATGITLCNSSTAATKTIGAADLWLDVLYE